ncbi:MAG TPA: hypothetical protein VEY92_07960 [Pseudoxanthomonas sp.]|nr:hypothetical protein [Pseudoxanthomonas sp.]
MNPFSLPPGQADGGGPYTGVGKWILFGAMAVSACAHAPEPATPATAPTHDPAEVAAPVTAPAHDSAAPIPTVPISRAEMTVENLLRWPLEGPAGVEKVNAGLHQVVQMKPSIAQQFSGDGPVRLADGYVLTFAESKAFQRSQYWPGAGTMCFTLIRSTADWCRRESQHS